MQLTMLGAVDIVAHHPDEGRYDVHVVDGPRLITDAAARIRQAGRKYHLTATATQNLIEHFQRSADAQ